MANLVGKDIPNMTYGTQEDYRRLYFSEPTAALKVPVTIQAGFGVLKMGTVMAENGSAAGNDGKLIPYDPTLTITGTENAPGRAYLVANSGGAYTVNVTIEDSYKFAVGDDIIIVDSDLEGAAENLGAITAIDRTTYASYAVITFTTSLSDTFTTAKFAYVVCEGYNTAVGVLEKSVDTGKGSTADGALGALILSNAVLYKGVLLNMDAGALTDLSAAHRGQFTVIK